MCGGRYLGGALLGALTTCTLILPLLTPYSKEVLSVCSMKRAHMLQIAHLNNKNHFKLQQSQHRVTLCGNLQHTTRDCNVHACKHRISRYGLWLFTYKLQVFCHISYRCHRVRYFDDNETFTCWPRRQRSTWADVVLHCERRQSYYDNIVVGMYTNIMGSGWQLCNPGGLNMFIECVGGSNEAYFCFMVRLM